MILTIEGMKEVTENLEKFGEQITPQIAEAINLIARDIAAQARSSAPRGTGKMAESIEAIGKISKNKNPYAVVRTDEYYARFLEKGTVDRYAKKRSYAYRGNVQPVRFLQNALDTHSHRLPTEIKAIFSAQRGSYD